MRDAAFDTLFPVLQNPAGRTLWIADENALAAVQSVAPRPDLYLLSNRVDVCHAATRAGHQAQFCDFDFSVYGDGFFDRVVFRLAKEKPVNHRVFNQAFRVLATGGQLHIAGLKNEGIKTFIDKTGHLFGNRQSGKYGVGYRGDFYKTSVQACTEFFDDHDYARLRLIETATFHFYSKPGLFGWDKVDQGSAFLAAHLPDFLACFPSPPVSMLDLGCGYGYLTLVTRDLPLTRRVATDNNAAALMAMQHNARHAGMAVDVVAADAGESLHETFDMILCNPPFHQGFSVDSDLTEKFLRNTRRLLSEKGAALMVVNAFIAIERIASQYFAHVQTLANNGSFKLVLLRPTVR
ncbi:MAG TPA: methyltransferase [Pseudomonadales bacterium]|nr:methyltransferase [Pseudomonadales bacterium]